MRIKPQWIILLMIWTLSSSFEVQKNTNRQLFDFNWKFALGDFPEAE